MSAHGHDLPTAHRVARTQRVRGSPEKQPFRRLFRAVVDCGLLSCHDFVVPCYLFTFHAYGSWMPDRRRGYTKRNKGYLPPDPEMAAHYARNMKQRKASFDREFQKVMAAEMLVASSFQRFRNHGMGSDPTHFHTLTSWRDERS